MEHFFSSNFVIYTNVEKWSESSTDISSLLFSADWLNQCSSKIMRTKSKEQPRNVKAIIAGTKDKFRIINKQRTEKKN